MRDANRMRRRVWLGVIGSILLSVLVACAKKTDPAVANSGGSVTHQRAVLTLNGAAR